MQRKRNNPFPVTGYWGPKYFCDREDEFETLKDALYNGRHALMISLRRLGKSALIQHLFQQLPNKESIRIYADLQTTANRNEMINILATASWRAAPEQTSWGKQIITFLKSLRPVVSYNELSGLPEVSLTMGTEAQEQATLQQLLDHLDKQKLPVYLALDEFQQIMAYPESKMEAFLRSIIQSLQNVTCIFAGSQQHLLTEMFGSAKRPFFGMTQILKLEKLSPKVYGAFIKKKFSSAKRPLSDDCLDFILTWSRRHTYYTQVLCNRIYSNDRTNITLDHARKVANQILDEQQPLFFTYRNMLTTQQWKLLKAIAIEQELYEPTSGKFTSKHQLGNASTVKRALDALLAKELAFKDNDESGALYYGVYDVFLSRWLEQRQ